MRVSTRMSSSRKHQTQTAADINLFNVQTFVPETHSKQQIKASYHPRISLEFKKEHAVLF